VQPQALLAQAEMGSHAESSKDRQDALRDLEAALRVAPPHQQGPLLAAKYSLTGEVSTSAMISCILFLLLSLLLHVVAQRRETQVARCRLVRRPGHRIETQKRLWRTCGSS
jgi:hypothetical protein